MNSVSSGGRWFALLGVGVLAILLGLLISVSAPMAARAGLLMLLAMVVLLAWAMPDMKTTARPIAWAFVVFAFVTVVWPRLIVFRAGGLPAVNPEKLAFVILLASWFWVVMTSSAVRSGLAYRAGQLAPVLWAVGILVAWRIVTAFAGEPAGYYLGLKIAATELLAYYLMLLIGLSVWRAPADVRPFVWAVVLAGVVVSLVGAYEALVSRNLFINFVSMDEDSTGRLAEAVREKFRSGKYRVQAGFEHPLVMAEFLVLAVPCALYLFVTTRRMISKAILLGVLGLFCTLVYKTDSRAALGMIGLTLVLAVLLFAYRSFRVSKSILGVVIGLLVPAVLITLPLLISLMVGLVESSGATGNASTSARVYMLKYGIPLVIDHPVFGFGVGQGGVQVGYMLFSGLYSIDNHYLGLALDSGLPALSAYVFAMIWFGWRLFRLVRDPETADGPLAICLFLALVGFCGMRVILSINTNTWLLFALMAAIGTLLPKARGEIGREQSRHRRSAGDPTVAILR